MNILPHKSWHVRTKKNIERVRRDEEKAAEEEKERQRRIALAEQEARTDLLRQRAKKRVRDDSDDEEEQSITNDTVSGSDVTGSEVTDQPLRHINFFSEIEEGKKLSGKNAEHEAEKKEEQEKLEMKIGLLTYLGQGSAESQTDKPWYLKKGSKKQEEEEDIAKSIKHRKQMDSLDPMNKMVEYVSKKQKSSHSNKHKKHKHKHRHHERKDARSEKPHSSGASTPSKSMDQLRAERLKREAEERQRTEELMRRLKGEPDSQDTPNEDEMSSRGQRYNSQYNPDLVRQPKHRREETESQSSSAGDFYKHRDTDKYNQHSRYSSSSRYRR